MDQFEVLTAALSKLERKNFQTDGRMGGESGGPYSYLHSNVASLAAARQIALPSFSADAQAGMALSLQAVDSWFRDGQPAGRRERVRQLVEQTLAELQLEAEGRRRKP